MSFHSLSITLAFLIIIALTLGSATSVPVRTERSEDSFVQNTEQFIPTNEWQTVKEGQAIPPGLHVRLNLQTGVREAKLLDGETQNAPSNEVVALPSEVDEQKRLSRENLERAFANLDLSKDDVITDAKHDEEVRTKFRPYDELKKDFEAMNMKVQTDHEILTELLKQLHATNNDEDRKTILTDLEYYLHQYDNAILFADMNGLQSLAQLLNNTNQNNDIRHLTSLAMGAALQGNPKVQQKALDLGLVSHLLRLINVEADENVKFRLLFTLSTLLRNFPQAQKSFVEHGGIETIVRIVDQTNANNKIQMRVTELMTDLIAEKDHATDDKRHVYDDVDIRGRLVKHDWCASLSRRLPTVDAHNLDHLGKTLTAMIPLADACRASFTALHTTLGRLADIHKQINAADDDDILASLRTLRDKLQQASTSDL